jgi:spermidine/putrescine transport system permease protein
VRGTAAPPAERRRSLAGWALLAPALLWTAAFFLLPLGVMTIYSFWLRAGTRLVRELTLANYHKFFTRSVFWEPLLNSLEVTLLTSLISVLLAYPLAYILAYRVPARWQRMALILAILPFWTSYVVRSYSWLLVLSEGGVVLDTLRSLGLPLEGVSLANNRAGTVIGFVHFFTMLLTLTIYANLVQISPNYGRAAADLGASPWQTFVHVTLPLSVPGVMVGAFLTFVLCIGDYVTPQILGGNRELLLPQAIMLQIGRRADFPMASALSLILMLVISLAFLASARWLKLERA